MITIRDLAKMTGISPATISRVLNNNPRVSEENRRRVLEAVEQSGYTPPKRQSAQPILLAVYSRLVFWEEMYRAIAREAKRLGYTPLSYCLPSSPGTFRLQEFEKEGLLQNRNIAGILLSTVELDPQEYRRLRQRFPVVYCGNPLWMHGGCAVSTDDFRASAAVVDKILDEGRTRIAFVDAVATQHDVDYMQQVRCEGAEWALFRRGLRPVQHWSLPFRGAGPEQELLAEVADEIAALPSRPDGIFCLHGALAMTLSGALRQRGLRVPEAISMASFDLDHFPRVEQRGSWFVRQNFEAIGRESVRMLDGLIRNGMEDGKRLYIDYRIELH